VENAFYHGISTLPGNGLISVLGFLDRGNMIFKVIDNGAGIEPAALERLRAYVRGENEDFDSIGIKNVSRRIRLYYGDPYGIDIESKVGGGTMVTVTLPEKLPEALISRNHVQYPRG
jgi:two-component system sensor histidine kinase YesM